MGNRFKSIVTEEDFEKYAESSITKTTESSALASDSWAWNDAYKAAHVNDATTAAKGCFTLPLGFLKMGDKLTFSCEFYNVSGVKGKIGLDIVGVENEFILQSEGNGNFETLETSFIVEKDGEHAVAFGVFTADVGEYYIRNCTVDIDSKYDEPIIESGVWTPVFATAGITYTVQKGTYFKLGHRVFVDFELQVAALNGTSGAMAISGLPYFVDSIKVGNLVLANTTIPTTSKGVFCETAPSSYQIYNKYMTDTSSVHLALQTHATDNSLLRGSLWYETI